MCVCVRVMSATSAGDPGRVDRVRELGRNHVEENSLKLKKSGIEKIWTARRLPPDALPTATTRCLPPFSSWRRPDTKAGVVEATDASFGTPIAIDARS